ncbi:unnamed protein product [Nyctereutes procyonoides]|uniref:(raccoon dog) hypothetical protein n=1 Tax=Nyctereutes procyonoides TaxID=34880 RepID=A0A811YJD6_NYCPR|nr:unnamed protein product [Nyctereutes procyonoides]
MEARPPLPPLRSWPGRCGPRPPPPPPPPPGRLPCLVGVLVAGFVLRLVLVGVPRLVHVHLPKGLHFLSACGLNV